MERIPLYSFIGPEGSGKSTQGRLLAKRLGIPCVSTGDMIRDAAKNDPTELGDACRRVFEEHGYLPGPLLLDIIAKRLRREDAASGVIVDGGFRTLEETEAFSKVLEGVGKDFQVKVIFLRVPAWESVERILKGNRKRDDDDLESILPRLDNFYTNLGKRTSYIRKNWEFITIFASGKSEEEVSTEVNLKL